MGTRDRRMAGDWADQYRERVAHFFELIPDDPHLHNWLDMAKERIAFAFPDWSEEQVQACAEGVWRYAARLFFEIARSHRLMNEDNWYIVDNDNHRVLVHDNESGELAVLGRFGRGLGTPPRPQDAHQHGEQTTHHHLQRMTIAGLCRIFIQSASYMKNNQYQLTNFNDFSLR